MGGSSKPFGSNQNYTEKTPNLSRDIIDWAKSNLTGPTGPPGPKGDTGDTGPAGADGENAPQVQARYSVDGISWHSTYNSSTDKYIQFSYDEGSTWDVAKILIKGEKGDTGNAAPNVKIRYSEDDVTYTDVQPATVNYIKFSFDDGDTWSAGFYVRGTAGDDGADGNDAPEVQIEYRDVDSGWTGIANSYTGTQTYMRISTDGGSTWSSSIKFVGTDGSNGDSAYLYIAYADDESGTGFTNTYNSSKDYIAIKPTTIPISSPNVSDFTGLWKNYKGTQGVAGTSSYTYIAWADADDGTGFTTTFDADKNYVAIKVTGINISSPSVSDFAGLWKNYKGGNGSNAEKIELPSASTVALRCDSITSQPSGWNIDSADNLSNPLSSNPLDLVIYHNTGKQVVDVIIKSKTIDKQTKLIGNAAYSVWEDDDTLDYLLIKSLATELTDLVIYILFES